MMLFVKNTVTLGKDCMLRVCVVLVLCVSLAYSDELAAFYAMGDTPYAPEDHALLVAQLYNMPSDALFAVHLGDIKAGASECTETVYYRAAEYLRTSRLPLFIVPGDNEWNDCKDPAAAWTFWDRYLMHFDRHWADAPQAERHPERDDLFAFFHQGVLFVGVNVVGGRVHDTDEWKRRHALCAAWIDAQVARYGSAINRLVILGHATPTEKHARFFSEVERIATDLDRPVLYIHGDGHTWQHAPLFEQADVLRVQVDQGGKAPPVRVGITDDDAEPFVFDRRLPGR